MPASQDARDWTGIYYSLSGDPVLGAAAPVPGTEWRVFTEIGRREALSRSRSAVPILGMGLSALNVLLILVWLLLGIWIVREHGRLTNDGTQEAGAEQAQ